MLESARPAMMPAGTAACLVLGCREVHRTSAAKPKKSPLAHVQLYTYLGYLVSTRPPPANPASPRDKSTGDVQRRPADRPLSSRSGPVPPPRPVRHPLLGRNRPVGSRPTTGSVHRRGIPQKSPHNRHCGSFPACQVSGLVGQPLRAKRCNDRTGPARRLIPPMSEAGPHERGRAPRASRGAGAGQ